MQQRLFECRIPLSTHSQGQVFIDSLGQLFQDAAPRRWVWSRFTVLSVLCLLVHPSVSALVQSSLSQMPSEGPLTVSLKFLFHSAMGGLDSYITWTPEGLPMGKGRRLWVRQSGVCGTIQGFGTLMLVVLLCPPPGQDFASLWSDCGTEVTSLTDSLLKSPVVLCVHTLV